MKIRVAICNDCGKPHTGRSKGTDRCWCDISGNFHWGEIEEESYNPYFKLEKPHVDGNDVYWYGFKCDLCNKQDMGHFSKNDKLEEGHTKLCSTCFNKSEDVQW